MADLKVVINNSSFYTPLGNSDSTIDSLIAGASAVSQDSLFDVSLPFAQFKNKNYRNLISVFNEISANLDVSICDPKSTVIIYASAKGDLSGLEKSFLSKNNLDNNSISPLLDNQVEVISDILGFKNSHSIVISNACASGQVALETAKELLEDKTFKFAIVVGFDSLSKFTVSGFNSLSALSTTKGAKPFDKNRDGLTMGECAGAVVLELKNPEKNDICIAGAGSSNDANHRTGPSRTGDGLYNAMLESLKDAKVSKDSIAAIKCHGTSTNYNDAMEAKALYSLFENSCPPAVSLKGALGHMSGGGSLVEVLIGAKLLYKNNIPPTANFETLGVDEPISISNKQQKIEGKILLCLAAGFGGLNSALVLERFE